MNFSGDKITFRKMFKKVKVTILIQSFVRVIPESIKWVHNGSDSLV